MLLKAPPPRRPECHSRGFSTLYRVDAIEGEDLVGVVPTPLGVSVPSIGSMLLKAALRLHEGVLVLAFQYPLSGRCY